MERNITNPRGQRSESHRRQACGAWTLAVMLLGGSLIIDPLTADEPASFENLASEYDTEVRPLLRRYCLECHSATEKEGELDLEQFVTLRQVRRRTKIWSKVYEMLSNGEMPPKGERQPSESQRVNLRRWLKRYLDAEALAGAGDPGPVVLRRLTNAEYDYTIHDLTKVALNPSRSFPTEGAAGEGFTNAGNALVMSPGLLRKYLDAGKEISQHAVLLPDGFHFSLHTSRRDWTDESLKKIRGFYARFSHAEKLADHYGHNMANLGRAGRIPLEEYFAITLSHRSAFAADAESLDEIAASEGLNAKYLRALWLVLNDKKPSLLLDQLRNRWSSAKPTDAAALAAEVASWQKGLWTFNPVGLLGKKGSRSRWLEPVSPILANQQLSLEIPPPKHREKTIGVTFVATDAGDGNDNDLVVFEKPRLTAEGQPDLPLVAVEGVDASLFGNRPDGRSIDPESICLRAPAAIPFQLPAELAGRQLVTTASVGADPTADASVQVDLVTATPDLTSRLLPSELTVSFAKVNIGADERTLSYRHPILVPEQSQTRARFESAMAEFRNLFPAALCYTQIVPVDELLTLTLYYREDDHLVRLMLDDAEKTQLDRLWDELRYVSREPLRLVDVLDSLLETTIDHPQAGIFDAAVKPFNQRADTFRKLLLASESEHVDALVRFATKAWRRPTSDDEEHSVRELYKRLRALELPHEEAFRLTLARVLIASSFLYRLEEAPEGTASARVSDWELASRLSYFLWSSLPDQQLRAAAAQGRLHQREVLLRQTRRMLRDPRTRRLAKEFACQWLHIYDFHPLETKSEKRFPEFAGLREDIHEESILFFTDLFRNDGSLLDLLNADYTFLNERLARFYDVAGIEGTQWRRVEGIQSRGRGGILALATILAKQSGATRTSPILRGNWVSEVLLGEKLPRPPKDVPQLEDAVPDGLSERQLIERHSSDEACAKCHARIDPFGFALEHFDAIGRLRQDSARGGSINARTTLPDGTRIEGLPGLRRYLLTVRRDDFLRQFARKLLGYAIGRELQLSDRPLVDEIMTRLAKNHYRFSVVVETIVLSDQFRMIRARSSAPSEQQADVTHQR